MASIRSRFRQAAAMHRRAAALLAAADAALTGYVPLPRPPADDDTWCDLAHRLTTAAHRLAPGWLSAPLTGATPPPPLAEQARPAFVRLGTAHLPGARHFPVIVPWQHIAFDAAPSDLRVPAALSTLLLRLLAAAPAGSLLVRLVDPHHRLAPAFSPLCDAGLMAPPATDAAGLEAALAEAQRWHSTRQLVLVVVAWPPGCDPSLMHRLAAVARQPDSGTHLLIGQWPPPEVGDVPLPGSTQVTMAATHAVVGHPPGGSFAAGTPPGVEASVGLHAQVTLEQAPTGWAHQLCARLAQQATHSAKVSLGDLLPDGSLWAQDATDGLTVPLRRPTGPPVHLRFAHPTRHWLVGGRAGSGKTTLLHAVLYSLATRYAPDQLAIYLMDPTSADTYRPLADALPHVRGTGLGNANRVRATLHEVAAEVARRGPARILCLLDGVDQLTDSQAHDLLGTLAIAPHQRVHLLLAAEGQPPQSLAEQCRVRIALPGGQVLDPTNDAAAGIALGTAIANTAGGLGGPRGATRAHEQLVCFPDPYADPVALGGLHHRLSGRPA